MNVALKKIRDENKKNLAFIDLGISKDFLLEIMGTENVYVKQGDKRVKIENPYLMETFQRGDRRILKVVFYYTELKEADGRITANELTPFIFEQDFLIGWGWDFLNKNAKGYTIKID